MSLRTRRGSLASRNLRSKLFVRALEDRSVPAAFVVNANTDTNTADPMDPLKGDLRYCIDQANLNPGPDTITFDASVTLVTMLGTELAITGDVTITGNGSAVTTIDGAGLSRILKVDDAVAGTSIKVSVSGLTLTNGKTTGSASADRGAGMFVQDEAVTLADVRFVANQSQNARGGALSLLSGGSITAASCTFTNNSATATNLPGGAINVAAGTLTLSSCTMTGNTAAGRGGALYMTGGTGIISSSTITSNVSTGTLGGGAISINGASLVVIGTTLSGNSAAGRGGALYLLGSAKATVSTSKFDASSGLGNRSGTQGGAVTVLNSTMTMTGSTATGNTSASRGGFLYQFGTSSLSIDQSVISANTANANDGGAINVFGGSTISLVSSTLSGNRAIGASSDGGAVYGNRAQVLVDRCTFSGNSAGRDGGGIMLVPVSANVVPVIRNSTFTGNTATRNGGGIALYINYGISKIQNCTIVGNSATGSGGGLSRVANATGTLFLDSTIIANNTNATAADFNGAATANNNLLKTITGATLTGSGNITGVDPDLGALINNGGLTLTMKPNPTSPVIDKGFNNADAQATDQTGATRAYGVTDIGAVEVVGAGTPAAAPSNLKGLTTNGGTIYAFSVSYTGASAIDVSTLGNTDIRVTGPNGFNQLATLRTVTGSGTNVTATYMITAPGGTWDLSDLGLYTVSVEPNQVADVGSAFVPAGAQGVVAYDVGQNFVVTNKNDSGPGSLRQAIIDAGNTFSVDTITFDPSLTGSTITLASTITIASPLTINGPGASNLAISGNNSVRIFNINGPGQIPVVISGVTLTAGRTSTNSTADRGAAMIISDESVTITNAAFTNNTATQTRGGAFNVTGLNTTPGIVTVTNTVFTNNSAGVAAGAVYSTVASLSFTDSTFSGNVVTAGNGGAIGFDAGTTTTASSLLLDRVTLSGNTANNGGAISINSSTTTTNVTGIAINIRNSTISGNRATGTTGGGGIILTAFGNTLKIQNSTVAFNTATGTGGGGGIQFLSQGGSATIGTVTLDSTIVSNNSATVGADIRTTVGTITANNSLILDALGQTIVETNPVGGDPLLLPLADNGGVTKTHALSAGSPAIDVGSNPLALTVDQRGNGFNRVVNGTIDVGAYEFNPSATKIVANPVTTPGATLYTFTATFSDSNGIDVTTIDAGDFTVTSPSAVVIPVNLVSVMPAGNGQPRTATFSFVPPGGQWDVTNTGTYTVAFTGSVSTTLGAAIPNGDTTQFRVVYGQTITVTSAADSGAGTLRQAIVDAAVDGPAVDTITFAPGLGPIVLGGAELVITNSLVINGPSTGTQVVNGGGLSRVFNIDDGSTSTTINVTISGLTITGGSAAADGGGIFLGNESLTLDHVVVSGNTTAEDGGGIGVASNGVLVLRNSTVSGNTALNGGFGGGIYFFDGGDLTIENSTINGNSAAGQGGGVYFFGKVADGTINVRNATISGNSSGTDGGGILVRGFNGNLLIQNSTLAFNTAASGGGGGLTAFNTTAGRITIESSIIANNTNALAPDVGSPATVNFSLIGNTLGTVISGGSNRLDVDPLLLPLANNGGTTQTHRLPANSPAVNFGSNTSGLTTDQRGGPRTVGITDIGAYETNPVAVTSVVINNGATQRSRVTTLRVNLSTVTSFANLANAFTLTRVSDSASVTLNAVLDGSGTFVTLTFTGGAVDGAPGNLSLQDGRYTLTMFGAEVTNVDGFDGNGDGIAGGDFTFGSTPYVSNVVPATGIFRLFGDASGNGKVESDDFLTFRLAFLSANDAFDFDGNGTVDSSDFLQFRLHFLAQIV